MPNDAQPLTCSLIDQLDRWRRDLGLDHRRFAQRLGMHEAAWSNVRAGRRPLPKRVIKQVLRERPELQYFVVADLMAMPTAEEGLPLAV
jgi:hypothetical protein